MPGPIEGQEERLPIPSRITMIYLVIGAVWNYGSDWALRAMVSDEIVLAELQNISTLLFVLASGVLLHVMIRRSIERIRRTEARAEAAKQVFYRGTILAVTSGKLHLVDRSDIDERMSAEAHLVELRTAEDLPVVRAVAEETAQALEIAEDRLLMLLLAVGEASSNAFRHAHDGRVRIAAREGVIQVLVEDRGPGIDTGVLPSATLMKGFSTKPSMGLGYTLILEGTDAVFLATGPTGTSLLMELEAARPPSPLASMLIARA